MPAEQQVVVHSAVELPKELFTCSQKNQHTTAVAEEVNLEEKGKIRMEKDAAWTLNNDKTVLLENRNAMENSFLTTVLTLLDAS